MKALARHYGVDIGTSPDICFERAMETLDRNKLLESMREALGLQDARIEIVETSTYPVPRGRLVFRAEDLGRPALPSAEPPVTWRGSVIYGSGQRFSIWARVRVSASVPRVVAVENLKRGEPIAAGKIRVAGRTPVRDLAAGAEIHRAQIVPAPDVKRGDMIDVEVRSGAARLVLTAEAETAGRSGDVITVRNPASKKLFKARILEKGRAFFDVSNGH